MILYVGRIAYEKNMFTLLDAFDKVWASDAEAQLLLIGDGPQRDEFEKYAAAMQSGGNVIFTGAIAHDELIKSGAFKASTLFATASRTETQGITILEAQANGMLAVAVREGGVVNLVKDGYNGFLTEPDDSTGMAEKILYILENRKDLDWMEKNTMDMVEIHRMDKIIDRWEALYTEMIEGKDSLPVKDYLHFSTLLRYTRLFKLDFRFMFHKINPMRLGARAQDRHKKIFRRRFRRKYAPMMMNIRRRSMMLRRRH